MIPLENTTYEINGAIATLTISRPKAMNALNAATFTEIEAVVAQVAKDESVRVLIVTGAGDKAFVAGADIKELAQITSSEEARLLAIRGQNIFAGLEKLTKPVIAAVNGFALGGGCELALSCDIRFAADTAKMGLPEITLGLLPGYGGSQRLARLVGRGMTNKMVFSGDMIDAVEAHRIGLVDEVVPAAELMATVEKYAAKLATRAPIALGLVKQAIKEGLEVDLDRGCYLEASAFGIAFSTEDFREGTSAFIEKRKAEFKGR